MESESGRDGCLSLDPDVYLEKIGSFMESTDSGIWALSWRIGFGRAFYRKGAGCAASGRNMFDYFCLFRCENLCTLAAYFRDIDCDGSPLYDKGFLVQYFLVDLFTGCGYGIAFVCGVQ